MHNSVVFPRGAGGNWLSNLIYNLEQGTTALIEPRIGQVYDGTTRTASMKFKHYFDLTPAGELVYYVAPDEPYLLFSTSCPFNLYLNDAIKVKLNPVFDSNIINATLTEQFFEFSNSAQYLLSDPLYFQHYYTDIDIDLREVFENPRHFVCKLFDLLDQETIQYTADENYAVESCKQFATTCPNPRDYVDNWASIEWLAWSHAVLAINNREVEQDLSQIDTVEQLQQVLQPHRTFVLERTAGLYFTWI